MPYGFHAYCSQCAYVKNIQTDRQTDNKRNQVINYCRGLSSKLLFGLLGK